MSFHKPPDSGNVYNVPCYKTFGRSRLPPAALDHRREPQTCGCCLSRCMVRWGQNRQDLHKRFNNRSWCSWVESQLWTKILKHIEREREMPCRSESVKTQPRKAITKPRAWHRQKLSGRSSSSSTSAGHWSLHPVNFLETGWKEASSSFNLFWFV